MKLTCMLGKGSFGSVYQLQCGQSRFALKKISLEQQCDSTCYDLQIALNQARIMSQFQHPNLVRYYHSYRKQDAFYILMEFAGKLTLNEFDVPLESQQIIDIISQISMGLRHLKKKRIIHRDLKPANIIVSNQRIFKIADFGISKVLAHSKTGTVLGTPFYTAPQILQQKKYDYQVDIWSLGVILYQLTQGKLPFYSEDSEQLKNSIITSIPLLLHRYEPQIEEIIYGCLQKEPQNRLTVEKILEYSSIQRHITKKISKLVQV